MCKAISVNRNTVPDYIYCLSYRNGNAVNIHAEVQSLVVGSTSISCNLHERQRSSQEILDLADYIQVHYPRCSTIPPLASRTSVKYKYDSPKKSFSFGIIQGFRYMSCVYWIQNAIFLQKPRNLTHFVPPKNRALTTKRDFAVKDHAT